MRKRGSGLNKDVTDAVERAIGLGFVGSGLTSADREIIQRAFDTGKSGVSPTKLAEWVEQLASRFALNAVKAEVPAPDHLGDVRLTLDDGAFVWIEVKAQTTKVFKELIQADWVREETDFLKFLYATDPDFRSLISPFAAEALRLDDLRSFDGWDLGSLWAADVALVTSTARRASAGVRSPADLQRFLGEKYVLHVARDGARMTRLDQIQSIAAAIDARSVHVDVAAGGSCDARVWIGAQRPPRRGSIDFVYYVGYSGHAAIGRHKGTDYLLRSSDGLVTVQS